MANGKNRLKAVSAASKRFFWCCASYLNNSVSGERYLAKVTFDPEIRFFRQNQSARLAFGSGLVDADTRKIGIFFDDAAHCRFSDPPASPKVLDGHGFFVIHNSLPVVIVSIGLTLRVRRRVRRVNQYGGK